MLIRGIPSLGARIIRASCIQARLSVRYVSSAKAEPQPGNPAAVDYRLLKKMYDAEEEECLYPSLKFMGVTTADKTHTFTASTDKVLQYIKLGAINKNLAIQYCHYLAHLTRESHEVDVEYYSKRTYDLMMYILRQDKTILDETRGKLLSDVADSNTKNCIEVCNMICNQSESPFRVSPKDVTKLICSAYKFGLWKSATALIQYDSSSKAVNLRLCDPLALALAQGAARYNSPELDSAGRNRYRTMITEHLYQLMDIFFKNRVQFVTRHKKELGQALDDLGFRVVKGARIRTNARCTSCDSHLPEFDRSKTESINKLVRKMLHEGAEKNLYVNTTPERIQAFEAYLDSLHKKDKRPIDCVIDGLNIAYNNNNVYYVQRQVAGDITKSVKKMRVESFANLIINAMIRNQMLKLFKKILVIGKEHMRGWPGLVDFLEKHKVHYYFSDNDCQDDLFQLYAATLSPKTVLITNDFLRDHLASMPSEGGRTMARWIDTHQGWCHKKGLRMIWPTSYEKIPSANREKNVFHIPVVDYNKLGINHEPPPHLNDSSLMWICCNTDPNQSVENKLVD